jgi:hypothetical protein
LSVDNVQSVVNATQKAVKAFSQLEIVKGMGVALTRREGSNPSDRIII